MEDTPRDSGAQPGLRLLRILVTVLTATMILAIMLLVGLFWSRLPGGGARLQLPAAISLPEGVRPVGFAAGGDWYAVVTDGGRILIFEQADGSLRQEIVIERR